MYSFSLNKRDFYACEFIDLEKQYKLKNAAVILKCKKVLAFHHYFQEGSCRNLINELHVF